MGILEGYIKEEWKNAIRTYKFNSTDKSLIYVHITSPLCNVLVEYIPCWITPNLITMCGFLCILIMNGLINYYSGLDGKSDIPTWAIVAAGILFPVYHIFDLIDGKHARKTGQSSPLGLLMDHGVDSLTTFLFMMSLGSILKLEGCFWFSFLWLLASIQFFACTWEEYHTNRLDFPEFHGVSEGTFIASGIMLTTAGVGQQVWLTPINILGNYYKFSNVFVSCFFFFSMLFVVSSFVKVYRNERTKSYLNALSNLTVFMYLNCSLLIVIFYSKSEIVEKYPKLILYMYGFPFCQLVVFYKLIKGIFTSSSFSFC